MSHDTLLTVFHIEHELAQFLPKLIKFVRDRHPTAWAKLFTLGGLDSPACRVSRNRLCQAGKTFRTR